MQEAHTHLSFCLSVCPCVCLSVCVCVHTHHGTDISMSEVGFLLQCHHMFSTNVNLLHSPSLFTQTKGGRPPGKHSMSTPIKFNQHTSITDIFFFFHQIMFLSIRGVHGCENAVRGAWRGRSAAWGAGIQEVIVGIQCSSRCSCSRKRRVLRDSSLLHI